MCSVYDVPLNHESKNFYISFFRELAGPIQSTWKHATASISFFLSFGFIQLRMRIIQFASTPVFRSSVENVSCRQATGDVNAPSRATSGSHYYSTVTLFSHLTNKSRIRAYYVVSVQNVTWAHTLLLTLVPTLLKEFFLVWSGWPHFTTAEIPVTALRNEMRTSLSISTK